MMMVSPSCNCFCPWTISSFTVIFLAPSGTLTKYAEPRRLMSAAFFGANQPASVTVAVSSVIGAEDTATVTLAGWFAPKNAALISRRGSAYFVSVPEGAKKITVNEEIVQGQKQLHDGDTIIIAGVHFQFFLK